MEMSGASAKRRCTYRERGSRCQFLVGKQDYAICDGSNNLSLNPLLPG